MVVRVMVTLRMAVMVVMLGLKWEVCGGACEEVRVRRCV